MLTPIIIGAGIVTFLLIASLLFAPTEPGYDELDSDEIVLSEKINTIKDALNDPFILGLINEIRVEYILKPSDFEYSNLKSVHRFVSNRIHHDLDELSFLKILSPPGEPLDLYVEFITSFGKMTFDYYEKDNRFYYNKIDRYTDN